MIDKPQDIFWRGKRVFLTGHSGFKGGWLALWLHKLGAIVHGFSLPPPTETNLFTLARVGDFIEHEIGDIRDLEKLKAAITKFKPDIILHLAAQAILRLSYTEPVETFAANVMGTVHVLEAARSTPSVQATLIVTTDKCYENVEQIWAYRESDAMGGHDPYSSSKGCAELVTAAYARSYFKTGGAVVASARAGNVIGGGDWAEDRLMTDVFAALMGNKKPDIRNPNAVRPWQHVLEPLFGYLRAVEHIWQYRATAPQAWNFGPRREDEAPVAQVVDYLCRKFGFEDGFSFVEDPLKLHEAKLLRLDSTKAEIELGWLPRLNLSKALDMTVEWRLAHRDGANMYAKTIEQISAFESSLVPTSALVASSI